MRRHFLLFAACAPLLASPVNAQDQISSGEDRAYNYARHETNLWASGSIHEEFLLDAEDADQGVDEDDPIDDPTADWA